MKAIKYWLSLLLSVLLFLVPAGCFVWFFAVYSSKGNWIWPLAFAGGTLLLAILLYKPVSRFRQQSRFDAEHDEFGRSKKRGDYLKLSKKERDAVDLQKTAQMETILDSSALKRMTKEGSKNPDADMRKLIGLASVKDKMEEMVARFEYLKGEKRSARKAVSGNEGGRHAVFLGSPGTGKTVTARIMTGFLYRYGYIKKNKIVEIDGNFLKAGADTATKTSLIIKRAYDGVLFIDEAYSLTYDSYGRQAIATIIKEMEDNRDRFILILAGYTDEMKTLIAENPGFASRIKEYLKFEDYSVRELGMIFEMMAKERGFTLSGGAHISFESRITAEMRLRDFGNARTVRNILDEAIDLHALNFIKNKLPQSERHVLGSGDIRTTPKER